MFGKSFDDYRWIIEHKEVTNFKVRRNLTMMMLEEARSGSKQKSYEMLIDRSYWARSVERVVFLVFREMFNPHKALFVACANDRRGFLPNLASKVDPLHLEYFTFCVVFDRVFFLQLAGEDISLEDVRDADPTLYSSCKQILEMDPETVDQDILSLTFAYGVEELGSRTTVELCPNGKYIVVNIKNRKEYVNLLIQHRFVTSIASQIAHFSQDLDKMLDGSGTAISVEDWKAHTDYNGYEENDHQICWFWKIIDCISAEQRKVLLFFWTSIKYLPLEGFCGLDSRLCISRTSEFSEHLPSAQTCFYQLRVPPYFNRVMMQNRLDMITQEHIGCSFGYL
ncbi:hypothetical protein KY289_010259 [Solanum tuberosum]|nr:hypothetical protein KY289_010259 [Solanum tuberosum]KAH0708409.1 hypothetical protein KY284_009836 [Solanum tuberosum]